MNIQYVCEMDGSVFTNEDALVEHIRNNFVKKFEGKNTDVTSLQELLHEKYPEWSVDIENGAGWYASYIIHLTKDSTHIAQYFGNEKDKNDQYYVNKENPETLENLVDDLNWKIRTYEELVSKIQSTNKFAEVYCKDFSYGYSSDEHNFTFGHKLSADDEYTYVSFYPWGDNHDKEQFVNSYKKYYLTVLEGEVHEDYVSGYFTGYTVDGVSIDGLINRARKIRIEIIE